MSRFLHFNARRITLTSFEFDSRASNQNARGFTLDANLNKPNRTFSIRPIPFSRRSNRQLVFHNKQQVWIVIVKIRRGPWGGVYDQKRDSQMTDLLPFCTNESDRKQIWIGLCAVLVKFANCRVFCQLSEDLLSLFRQKHKHCNLQGIEFSIDKNCIVEQKAVFLF